MLCLGAKQRIIIQEDNDMRQLLSLGFALLWASTLHAANPSAEDILKATGVTGGLVVHVGCDGGKLTAALHADDMYLVHGLDTDAEQVAEAREHIHSQGLYGKVSVDTFDGEHLPYAENLVNLLVAEDLGEVSMKEVMRVLAPLGVAYIGGRKIAKPWPKDIDEWSHYLHDATGNAVAHDGVVAAPKHLQWIGGPLWTRSHEYDASLCAMVSSRGRLFYIFDEGPTGIIDKRIPDRWTLIARDAFSGVILWKREVPLWGWKAWRTEMENIDWRTMRSQRNLLPLGAPRRLVTVGDRVYVTLGYHAPVTELDAATGETLRTFKGTERADEIICQAGTMVLLVRPGETRRQTPEPLRIQAINVDTGTRLWEIETPTIVGMSLAMSGRNVLFHDGDSVVCIHAASGKRRWQTQTAGAGLSVINTNATLVIYEDVVLCANQKQLVGLSIDDGRVRWELPGARGFGAVNPPDLFIADGLVWYGQGSAEPESITGYDPLTGKPGRTIDMGPLITHGHHARCYRSKGTDNYLLLPKRATEFIDIKGDQHSRHNWLRGACRYGMLPCNGLLYGTPHPCFCYAGVRLGGFIATAPAAVGVKADVESETARLEKGPAYGKVLPSTPDSAAWPMYRHDPKRSGSTVAVVDTQLRSSWEATLGGRLTQPVVVGDKVFVARVDAAQICCLDAATGKPVWDFIAGGRIDSSPTFHDGQLLFGSADGWVYCLRASDGELAWRFLAAPEDRRVVAFGQVESAWPVHGSVLVLDDVAYFTAGRSSFLDGGIFLYGLDPATGRAVCTARIDGPHPNTKVRDDMAYSMEGSKSDILVTDGERIYLFHNVFDKRLKKLPTPVKGEHTVRNLGERDIGYRLFSNAGLLDTSGFNRNYWMVDDRWPGFNFAHQSPKAGQIVVFDEQDTFAVKCYVRRNMLSPQGFPGTDGHYLVADSHTTRPVAVKSNGKGGPEFIRWLPQDGPLQTCWNLGVGFARAQPPKWVSVLPVRIRSMVRTKNSLLVAGPPDICPPDDPTAALEGRAGAILMAIDPANGKTRFECKLDTPPVFDGMSAAYGKLFVSLENGEIECWAGRE